MERILIKHKRQTVHFLPHFDVFVNGFFVGYFIKNKSKFAAIGENYNFCPHKISCAPFFTSSKKNMLIEINKIFNDK
jgi:hypothetical protein